jgi:hypothetical protein
MENSGDQVKVLIWPGQGADPRSVDPYGHVELCIVDMCYGFGPDETENPSKRARVRGCKGFLSPSSFTAVATRYLDRVITKLGYSAVLDPARHKDLPTVWPCTFEASSESMQNLVAFLESQKKDLPLYAAVPKAEGTKNCQTFALDALRVAGIFHEPSFDNPRPDALLKLLKEGKGHYPGLIEVEELHLSPPSWVKSL